MRFNILTTLGLCLIYLGFIWLLNFSLPVILISAGVLTLLLGLSYRKG